MQHALLSVLALSFLVSAASASDVAYVTDSGGKKIWRCADSNADGDLNDAGEATLFYDGLTGAVPLTSNVAVRSGPGGAVFVCDSSLHYVVELRDSNADGDASDAGEAWIFFDGRAGGNAGGVLMTSGMDIWFDSVTGWWYAASANTGSGGNDAILRFRDANADDDANDVGEQSEYYVEPAATTGQYIPSAVAVGLDGNVYYVENGTNGPLAKGVYKLVDVDANGMIDPTEVFPFFVPPTQTATPFFWNLERDASGTFFMTDTGNELVWRFGDANANGTAQDPGESSIYWAVGAASNLWDTALAADGSIWCAEAQTPQRLLRLFDANANGTIEAGEVATIYQDSLAATDIGTPRGIDLSTTPSAGTGFCFGDGTGSACPCSNTGDPGKGCANSIAAGGALLSTQGVASVSADTLSFAGNFMPDSTALYFQGTTQIAGGTGIAFGDGLRCVGGPVVRFPPKVNVGGASHYPEPGDPSIASHGGVVAGDVRTYQVWYRNADPGFCTSATFNLSNGIVVTWLP